MKRETDGHYMAPAIFTDTAQEMRINQEEIFGPVAAVIRVRDYEEALAVANEFMDLHVKHWPEFEGESEVRQIMDLPMLENAKTEASASGRA